MILFIFLSERIHNVFHLQRWRSRYVRHCPMNPSPASDKGGVLRSEQKADRSATVARIAYVCSDVILSVQPTLGRESEFSRHLQNLVTRKSPSIVSKDVPEVHSCSQTVL